MERVMERAGHLAVSISRGWSERVGQERCSHRLVGQPVEG